MSACSCTPCSLLSSLSGLSECLQWTLSILCIFGHELSTNRGQRGFMHTWMSGLTVGEKKTSRPTAITVLQGYPQACSKRTSAQPSLISVRTPPLTAILLMYLASKASMDKQRMVRLHAIVRSKIARARILCLTIKFRIISAFRVCLEFKPYAV